MDEYYMNEALKEAKKAYDRNEVPIGAIIVQNNKIIARAYNKKESSNIATGHAEILAINKACKKIDNWRLKDCTLYVTVEPCLMCAGAIMQSRLKKIVYGAPNENYGYVESIDQILDNEKNHFKIEIIGNVLQEKSTQLLQKFFEEKRK